MYNGQTLIQDIASWIPGLTEQSEQFTSQSCHFLAWYEKNKLGIGSQGALFDSQELSKVAQLFKACRFGCQGNCADYNEGSQHYPTSEQKSCTAQTGWKANKCADADHPTCASKFADVALMNPDYLMDLMEGSSNPTKTGFERTASSAWRASAYNACQTEGLDEICPNTCKLAGRVVHGCTTVMSSAWGCEKMKTYTADTTSFVDLASPASLAALNPAALDDIAAMNFWFEAEGNGPDVDPQSTYSSRHCIGIPKSPTVSGTYYASKTGCQGVAGARLCMASEVEMHVRADVAHGSSSLALDEYFWTQSSERVAGGASCSEDEVLVSGAFSTPSGPTEYREKCVERSGAASTGLCCGDDTTFIVS